MRKKQDNRLYCPYWTAGSTPPCNVRVWGEEPGSENYLYVCGGYPTCDSYIGVHKRA